MVSSSPPDQSGIRREGELLQEGGRRPLLSLLALLTLAGGLWLVFVRLPAPNRQSGLAVALLLLAGALYVVAVLVALKWARHASRRSQWLLVVGAALLFRILLLTDAPTLSDDIWRYLWDGGQILSGASPYGPSPEEIGPTGPDADLLPLINHPQLPSIYPPVAQAAFAVGRLFGRSPRGMKVLFVFADVLLILLLGRLLQSRRRPPIGMAVYAWHPLPIVEIAGSGHVDGLAALALVACLYAVQVDKWRGATIAGVAAAGVKIWPAILLAPLVAHAPARRKRQVLVLGAVGLTMLALPMVLSGTEGMRSVSAYLGRWEFNNPIYYLLKIALGGSASAARAVLYLILAALIGYVFARCWTGSMGLVAGLIWLCGGYLALSPTVYPWYALPMIALLSVGDLKTGRVWILWTLLLPLSYELLGRYAATGVWQERWWVMAMEWTPLVLGLMGILLADKRAGVRRDQNAA